MKLKNPNKTNYFYFIPALVVFSLASLAFPGALPAAPGSSPEVSNITGVLAINGSPSPGAVVYLEEAGATPTSPGKILAIRQKGKQFEPDFAVVTMGDRIRFENLDNEIHNIQSRSLENRFDTGAHMPGTVKEITLKKPGAVLLRCRTHHEMKATVFVAPTPFHAVTDSQGRYELLQIPVGRYRLKAWHPRLTPLEQEQGEVDLDLSKDILPVRLEFSARAPEGHDLTANTGKDWTVVVEEIEQELKLTVSLWQKGKQTAAARRIMSTLSKLYGESGLQSAIEEHFNLARAAAYEKRFDSIRKQVQGLGSGKPTAEGLKQEVEHLVRDLRNDAGEMTKDLPRQTSG